MTTRRPCSECGSYFQVEKSGDKICDECVKRQHDLASAMIVQDNGPDLDFLRPVDAMSLARVRVENARLEKERNRWKTLAISHHTRMIAISQTKMLGKPQKIAADGVELFYSEFADLAEEFSAPVYSEGRG